VPDEWIFENVLWTMAHTKLVVEGGPDDVFRRLSEQMAGMQEGIRRAVRTLWLEAIGEQMRQQT